MFKSETFSILQTILPCWPGGKQNKFTKSAGRGGGGGVVDNRRCDVRNES